MNSCLHDKLPKGVSVTAAFCAAAVLNDELPPDGQPLRDAGVTVVQSIAERTPEAVAAVFGFVPEANLSYSWRNQAAVRWLDGFRQVWTWRAMVQIGTDGCLLRQSKPLDAKAAIIGYEGQIGLARNANAPAADLDYLSAKFSDARDGVKAWYRERMGKTAADASPATEARVDAANAALSESSQNGAGLNLYQIRPRSMATAAAAYYGAAMSEGHIVEHFAGIAHVYVKTPLCRVEIREKTLHILKCGRELLQGDPASANTLESDRPTPKGALTGTCPVCFWQFGTGKSLAMHSGMNIGAGGCPACGWYMQIRLFDGDTPTTEGNDVRTFRTIEDAERAIGHTVAAPYAESVSPTVAPIGPDEALQNGV